MAGGKTINNTDVDEAFKVLLEEIQKVYNDLSKSQFQYNKKNYSQEIKRILDFLDKLKTMKEEWDSLFNPPKQQITKPYKQTKLQKGLKTTESEFKHPILEALVELGGRARMRDVLNKVEQKMKAVLKDDDYQHLKSSSIRWKNTAQWCRNTLVNEGLMSKGSPRGVWEISEEGKEWLKNN